MEQSEFSGNLERQEPLEMRVAIEVVRRLRVYDLAVCSRAACAAVVLNTPVEELLDDEGSDDDDDDDDTDTEEGEA